MKILTIFLFMTICTLSVYGQPMENNGLTKIFNDTAELVQSILNSEAIQHTVDNTLDIIDIQIHYLELLPALFTPKILVLFRRTLEWFVSISNTLIKFLPENVDKPTFSSIIDHIFGVEDYEDDDDGDEDEDVHMSLNVSSMVDKITNGKTGIPNPTSTPKGDVYKISHIVDKDAPDDDEYTTNPKIDLPTTAKPESFANPPSKPTSATDIEGGALTKEQLELLKSYGMSPEDAKLLANHIFNEENEVSRSKRGHQGAQPILKEKYAGEISQAMTLSKLINAQAYRKPIDEDLKAKLVGSKGHQYKQASARGQQYRQLAAQGQRYGQVQGQQYKQDPIQEKQYGPTIKQGQQHEQDIGQSQQFGQANTEGSQYGHATSRRQQHRQSARPSLQYRQSNSQGQQYRQPDRQGQQNKQKHIKGQKSGQFDGHSEPNGPEQQYRQQGEENKQANSQAEQNKQTPRRWFSRFWNS